MNWNFRVLRGLARLTFAQQLILLALVPAALATLDTYAEEGLFEQAITLEDRWADAIHGQTDGPS